MIEAVSSQPVDSARTDRRAGGRSRRRAFVIPLFLVGVVIVSSAVSYFLSLRQQPVYGAETEILFDPGPELSDAAADRAIVTQETVLHSAAVLEPVSREMGVPLADLRRAVETDVVGSSNIIRLTVMHPSPATARRLAELITTRYTEQLRAVGLERVTRSTQYLEQTIEGLNEALRGVEADIDALAAQRVRGGVPSAQEEQLVLRSQQLQQQITQLTAQYTAAALDQLGEPEGIVLTPPRVLDDPLRPRPIQALALGAVIGMAIAGAVLLILLGPRLIAADEQRPRGV